MAIVDRDIEKLKLVALELREKCADVISIEADLSDPAAPQAIVDQVGVRFDGLDAVVSNAGMIQRSSIKDLNVIDFDRYIAVNTRATWLFGKAAYDMLRESRGSIVATASIASEHPTPPAGAYATSKSALVMLVRQMALEWAPDGIRCNCVSPGSILTGMHDITYATQADKDRRASQIPLRRLGRPDDIANAILFLMSPEASYITGVNLFIDGGLNTVLVPASGSSKN